MYWKQNVWPFIHVEALLNKNSQCFWNIHKHFMLFASKYAWRTLFCNVTKRSNILFDNQASNVWETMFDPVDRASASANNICTFNPWKYNGLLANLTDQRISKPSPSKTPILTAAVFFFLLSWCFYSLCFDYCYKYSSCYLLFPQDAV